MKKLLLILTLSFAFSALSFKLSYAHVLETNGSLGAVMHIDPNDNPVAGKMSTIFFEIKDKEGKFKPEICNCTVSVRKDEKELFSKKIFTNDTNPSFSYRFPEKGDYEIRLSGEPKTQSGFNKFEIEYPVKVSQAKSVSTSNSNNLVNWLGAHVFHLLAGIIILAMSAVFIILRLMGKIKD